MGSLLLLLSTHLHLILIEEWILHRILLGHPCHRNHISSHPLHCSHIGHAAHIEIHGCGVHTRHVHVHACSGSVGILGSGIKVELLMRVSHDDDD